MSVALLWLRQDLRLADNPALIRALASCERVVPVYIHAPEESGDWRRGAASNWWLHHALGAFETSLRALGSRLILRRGPSLAALTALVRETGASHLFWNRLYEPAHVARDTLIKEALRAEGLTVHSGNAALLFEPWARTKDDGTPYRVFTPFWRGCLKSGLPTDIAPAPQALPPVPETLDSTPLAALGLLPSIPWDSGLRGAWSPGESGAQARLEAFLTTRLADYGEDRDRPDHAGTSQLSPHLHFGEIGPRQIVAAVEHHVDGLREAAARATAEGYLRELGWREFAHHLLFHFPRTPQEPLDPRFTAFPWAERYAEALAAWQRGHTGIPIVDAGLRQLWTTGWMHNRVRMLVASFLTKNLLIPWQEGARWFWDTLVDADLANNTLGWQWTAGCGADAAPYFRIFNPVTQGEKFDPEGDYVRQWVPELARLPAACIHQPWSAPPATLSAAGVRLGRDYPEPLVDLRTSRARALARFGRIKR